jgi:lysozyme family protein
MTTNLKFVPTAVCLALVVALTGCAGEVNPVDAAQAKVTAAESAVADAQAALTDASRAFCDASEAYITALDRYGDVLNETAPTVGDVKVAGADLAKPRDNAFDDAQAALDAQASLVVAQQDLADAQAELAQAQAGPSGAPVTPETVPPAAPLVSPASVDRVEQAESEFETAQASITDDTPLTVASEQFNAAAVALEVAWLRLFADAGCLPEDQKALAAAQVSAYTAALQQSLTDAGYYTGAVDGIYGPETVAAVEALQSASGLPVTGTVDKATADALQAALEVVHGAASQESVATTAAIQQTLKLAGFWDGPVDGIWTPELTDAVIAFQVELGVEPTGTVDAATIAAFQQALAELTNPEPEPSPTPEG